MKICNRITWPRQTHTCVHTSIYGFSVAERNVQPFLTFPLFLNKALAKVTEKLNSPIYYYILLFTASLPESAVFRVAPFFSFYSPSGKKKYIRENTTEEGRRMDMALPDWKAPRGIAAPSSMASPPFLGRCCSLLGKEGGKDIIYRLFFTVNVMSFPLRWKTPLGSSIAVIILQAK